MTAPIPTSQPAQINAGDTAKWLLSLPDYPASDGWTLTVTLVNAAVRHTVTAIPQVDDYLVNASAATTSGWAAGTYATRTQVSKAGEVYTVGSGQIVVAASFAAAVDARSQARRTLEAIEATLEGRATADVQQYEIAGRRMTKIPIPELLALRDRLRVDVQREEAAQRAAAGLAPRGRVYVRFGA